jgi:photosystem II stability/assembly factor-like uncharacterized protein
MVGGVKMYEDCIEAFSCNRRPNGCAPECYRTVNHLQCEHNNCVNNAFPNIRVYEGPGGRDGKDGAPLEFKWVYTHTEVRLAVRVKGTEEWVYSPSLLGPGSKGDKGDPGSTPYPYNGTWWIDGVDTGVSCNTGYQLPIATKESLGGIKVGDMLSIDENGILTFNMDETITKDSINPISSGAVFDALEKKQDNLTFDEEPTDGSDNPVKSKGIKKFVKDSILATGFGEVATELDDIDEENLIKNKPVSRAIYNVDRYTIPYCKLKHGAEDWTKIDLDVDVVLRGVASDDTVTVVVGDDGTIITSKDNINWAPQVSGTTENLISVCKGPDKFVAVGNTGTIVTSEDTDIWSLTEVGVEMSFLKVKYINGKYLFLGYNGFVAESENGTTLTNVQYIANEPLTDVDYFNGNYVLIGAHGTIMTSPDLSEGSWTTQYSNDQASLRSMVICYNKLMVVGNPNIVLLSEDGLTWTIEEGYNPLTRVNDILEGTEFTSVCYDGIEEVVTVSRIGDAHYAIQGTDEWHNDTKITNCNGVAWCRDKFVAVGYDEENTASVIYTASNEAELNYFVIYDRDTTVPEDYYVNGKALKIKGPEYTYHNENFKDFTNAMIQVFNKETTDLKQINGLIQCGMDYELAYNGESWDIKPLSFANTVEEGDKNLVLSGVIQQFVEGIAYQLHNPEQWGETYKKMLMTGYLGTINLRRRDKLDYSEEDIIEFLRPFIRTNYNTILNDISSLKTRVSNLEAKHTT